MNEKTLETIKYVTKWVIFACLISFAMATLAFILKFAIQLLDFTTNDYNPVLTILLAAFLLLLFYKVDAKSAGYGSDHYLRAVNEKKGLNTTQGVMKLLSTITTIGSGASGGLTGPTLYIASAIVKPLKRFLSDKDDRIIMITAAASMLGAILASPLAAGIFVVEITYRTSLHYKDTFPAILGSMFGYTIGSTVFGLEPILYLPNRSFHFIDYPMMIVTAVLGGAVAILYMKSITNIKEFKPKWLDTELKLMIGALLTGLLVWMVPEARGLSTSLFETNTLLNAGVIGLLTILLAKLLATSIASASGMSAGLILPAIILGALTGAIVTSVIPYTSIYPMIAVGIASVLAGVANAPFAALVLVIELGGTMYVIPAVLGAVIGYSMSNTHTIYDKVKNTNTGIAIKDRI